MAFSIKELPPVNHMEYNMFIRNFSDITSEGNLTTAEVISKIETLYEMTFLQFLNRILKEVFG